MTAAPVEACPAEPVTVRRVMKLWWPLAGSWLLMAVELPLFSAVVARMPDPKINLAAFSSLVFPVALVIEGPIMMLLAASTALSRDLASYRKLHRFMTVSSAALTALHALVAFTPLYGVVAAAMGIEPEIAGPGRLGLAIMLPWTWAIARRRLQQGVLIRFERSREVWIGTLLRVATNATVLCAGYAWGGASGIAVGASGFSAAVLAEMAFVGWRTRVLIEGPLATAPAAPPLRRSAFLAFYAPLALSPILMLIVQPLGAAAMARMPNALNSLACWTPVWGLVFITRSAGFALNEVVVALLGRPGAIAALRRFALLLAGVTVSILLLVAATPFAALWFDRVSGLSADLVAISRVAVAFAIAMPGCQALQSWYAGALVHQHKTRGVTESVVVYLVVAAATLWAGVSHGGFTGIYFALASLSLASIAQTALLAWRARVGLRELEATERTLRAATTAA